MSGENRLSDEDLLRELDRRNVLPKDRRLVVEFVEGLYTLVFQDPVVRFHVGEYGATVSVRHGECRGDAYVSYGEGEDIRTLGLPGNELAQRELMALLRGLVLGGGRVLFPDALSEVLAQYVKEKQDGRETGE